jgi:hypothetical protein
MAQPAAAGAFCSWSCVCLCMAVCGLRDKELQQALIRGVSCGVAQDLGLTEWGNGVRGRRVESLKI